MFGPGVSPMPSETRAKPSNEVRWGIFGILVGRRRRLFNVHQAATPFRKMRACWSNISNGDGASTLAACSLSLAGGVGAPDANAMWVVRAPTCRARRPPPQAGEPKNSVRPGPIPTCHDKPSNPSQTRKPREKAEKTPFLFFFSLLTRAPHVCD